MILGLVRDGLLWAVYPVLQLLTCSGECSAPAVEVFSDTSSIVTEQLSCFGTSLAGHHAPQTAEPKAGTEGEQHPIGL
jgi:hypothetical protein